MTSQQIFSKVRAHLLAQGCRAVMWGVNGDRGCAYRGVNGTKCAVGCLIPDELYQPKFENNPASEIVLNDLALRTHILGDEPVPLGALGAKVDLLSDLQMMHDRNLPVDWGSRLAEIAEHFGLENV